jgi:hypothetical protein
MEREMENAEALAVEIISLMEQAKLKMEALRDGRGVWNPRALSIAITELETAQLWLANARPE